MICPNCEAVIEDESEFCYNCGARLKKNSVENNNKNQKKSKKNKIFDIKKNNVLNCDNKDNNDGFINRFFKENYKKMILISLLVLLAVILIIVLMIIFNKETVKTGRDYAEKLGEKAGFSIVEAEKNAGIHMEVASQCDAINRQKDFTYIYECEEKIVVDGVHVPEWLIKVDMLGDKIHKVYYRNYMYQDDNYKGEKLDEPINLDDIITGKTSCAKVENIFEIEPKSITYYDNQTVYCYRYYIENEHEDEESIEVVITFDKDGIVSKCLENNVSNNVNIY